MFKSFDLLILSLTVAMFVQSCNNQNPVDSKAVKEEMSQRELKRVSNAQLMEKGMEIGNSIADDAQGIFQKALLTAIEEGGITGAIGFCNLEAQGLVSHYQDSLGVKVMRVSEKNRNPDNQPDSLELMVLEAYAYEHENGNQLNPSLIEESEFVLLYTRPILLTNTLCLNCHGQREIHITAEVQDTLLSLYPNDQAQGYNPGDLRGMWTIRIPKKTIVNLL